MRAMFSRLGHEDDGSHPLEFALLVGGVVIALFQRAGISYGDNNLQGL